MSSLSALLHAARRIAPGALAVLLTTLIVPSPARAAAPAPASASASAPHEEIVAEEPQIEIMGATKHPIPLIKAAQNVSVITRKEIQEINPRNLGEILRLMAGVDVIQKSIDNFDVSAQGLNKEYSNQLLVLIDGKPVMNGCYGHTWWREIPVVMDSIERVEVIKGPGSAQWGANAFAGVINIVTDHSSPKTRQGARAQVRVGERGYLNGTVRATDWKKDHGFTATLDYWSANDRTPLTHLAGDAVPQFLGIDRNDIDKFSGILDFEKQYGTHTKLSLRWSTVRDYSHDPATFARVNSNKVADVDVQSHFLFGEVTHRLSDKRAVGLKVQSNYARNDFGRNPLYDQTLDADTKQIDRYVDVDLNGRSYLGKSKYIYGLTYRDIVSEGVIVGDTAHSVNTKSAYGQMEYDFDDKTQGFVGLILYDSSMTGFDYSPKLSLVHELKKDRVVRFGLGKAFRAPDSAAYWTAPVKYIGKSAVLPGAAAGLAATLPGQLTGPPLFLPAPFANAITAGAVNTINGSMAGSAVFSGPTMGGNPDLDNESISQIDLGFEERTNDHLVKFDTWYAEVENLIVPMTNVTGTPLTLNTGVNFSPLAAFFPTPPFPPGLGAAFAGALTSQFAALPTGKTVGMFMNQTGKLYDSGFSVELGKTVSKKLRLDGNYTYQDLHLTGYYSGHYAPGDRSGQFSRTYLDTAPFAPHWKANFIARWYPTDRQTLTGIVHHNSGYYSQGAEDMRQLTLLPEYTTFDLSYNHVLGKKRQTAVNLAVKNLFNDVHHEFIRALDSTYTQEFGGIQLDRVWLARIDHQF